MSAPEALNDNGEALPEEVVNAFTDDLCRLIARMPPEVQARLMGFVHLVEDPARVEAQFEVGAKGKVRLVKQAPRLWLVPTD